MKRLYLLTKSIVLPIIITIFFNTPINAQEFVKWWSYWDKLAGYWYGKDNTVVRLTASDYLTEPMIDLYYNGTDYNDALTCTSETVAMSLFLSRKKDYVSAGFDIVLNNTKQGLTIKLTDKDTDVLLYESNLTRDKPKQVVQKSNNAGIVTTVRAETVARNFCEALYKNDMKKAKSYMTAEDARRTPDNIREDPEILASYRKNLNSAKFKVIENEYTDNIVTVRFYDPSYPYLDKRGRWFGCAIELVKINGSWKVTNYGY